MANRSWVLAALCLLVSAEAAHAQSSAFTYQGRLTSSALPASGGHDFEFRLFDALTSGNQLGATMSIPAVVVSEGLFTVGLNFGNVFDGAPRFLEIASLTRANNAVVVLAPTPA